MDGALKISNIISQNICLHKLNRIVCKVKNIRKRERNINKIQLPYKIYTNS